MKAIGIILAGGNNHRMKALTEKRAIAAMPIAGSYRAIDFSLSNMTNSHIQKVGVFTQYNAKSLTQHLSSSKWWDFGRKQGGLFVFTPSMSSDHNFWSTGTADAIYQNLSFLKDSHEPYVIIASGDGVYKMNYNTILEYHIEKKADITVVCRDMAPEDEIERYGVVSLDEDDRIVDFEEKPIEARSRTISCGIYVIRRRQLIELIEKCAEEDRHDFVSDILVRYKGQKRIYAYHLTNYWRNIATVKDYYETNMDFLRADVQDYFFHQYPDVYSKVEDLPPAKYNQGSAVWNSLISTGCILNGVVRDSVLFRKVFVGNNCLIRNSIILNDVYIGDNTHIENCIVESHGTIRANSYYKGEDGVQIVVEKSERFLI
ncbi:MAG: glucose-1-phosphate adenylyltransferase subunit GlgD [Lachnospiraceae bacterium]|nr:glucose-1-phosphate adenylyltransferase subunit GlgD [Lachnospiraceae bacterium]